MPTDDAVFEPAQGRFTVNEDFLSRGQNHHDGWDNAVSDALLKFRRNPGDSYAVTVVLSATVLAESNPGRITEYIATIV
jgi:hypothetical protein